ncbi:hypothetical protein PGQ11_010256 [Apiospora arundinis]|uniref:Uncharacterized protein n=1 Tax=Apiospora arundinis TaxID=335852 RepID=A0ABR2I9N8_9PEZI
MAHLFLDVQRKVVGVAAESVPRPEPSYRPKGIEKPVHVVAALYVAVGEILPVRQPLGPFHHFLRIAPVLVLGDVQVALAVRVRGLVREPFGPALHDAEQRQIGGAELPEPAELYYPQEPVAQLGARGLDPMLPVHVLDPPRREARVVLAADRVLQLLSRHAEVGQDEGQRVLVHDAAHAVLRVERPWLQPDPRGEALARPAVELARRQVMAKTQMGDRDLDDAHEAAIHFRFVLGAGPHRAPGTPLPHLYPQLGPGAKCRFRERGHGFVNPRNQGLDTGNGTAHEEACV